MSGTIGFIGLGTMGGPMAARLAKAGHEVRGFDVDRARVDAAASAGVVRCDNIADACRSAEIVITILPRDQDVRAVLTAENGVIDHAAQGSLVVEMSTIMPGTSVEMATRLKAKGIRMMDAPVGRTPADAGAGTLLVMAGGSKEDFEEAAVVFRAFADKILHIGALGSGIRMKVINNYMAMVGVVLTAETLAMAKKAGIATATAVEVLQNTVAGRGQINVNFPQKVLAGDLTPDFPLTLGQKDLALGVNFGRDIGCPLFLGEPALELFRRAPEFGRAHQDCTAMLLILEELAGIDVREG